MKRIANGRNRLAAGIALLAAFAFWTALVQCVDEMQHAAPCSDCKREIRRPRFTEELVAKKPWDHYKTGFRIDSAPQLPEV